MRSSEGYAEEDYSFVLKLKLCVSNNSNLINNVHVENTSMHMHYKIVKAFRRLKLPLQV